MESIDGFFIPTIHRRFLNRATFLRRHPPFRRFLDEERDTWSARYPAFRLDERSIPPHGPSFVGMDTPHPQRLMEELSTVYEYVDRGRLTQQEHDRYQHAEEARLYWRDRMRELCNMWWPPEYYPNPIGHHRFHPALAFVGGCMLYRLDLVPDRWVKPYVSGVQGVYYDPGDIDNIPEVVFYRTLFSSTVRHLNSALESGTVITPDVIGEAARSAFDDALRQRQERDQPLFQYVAIYPGMTTSDWRALEPIVQDSLSWHLRREPLDAVARRLVDEGKSIRSVAGLLGVSRRTVERMLGRT